MGHSQLNLTLSTHELAARVGVHEKTIRRQCLAGAIPAHCYTKGGTYGSYRFLGAAVAYFTDHGEWPTQAAMARYGRALRRQGEGAHERARGLVHARLSELDELLAQVDEPTVIYQALGLEAQGRGRKGALAAMRRRLAELVDDAA